MSAELLLAVVALVVSVAALAVSSLLSWRQLTSMRHANHLPVTIELLTRDFMDESFQASERLALTGLPAADPDAGFSGLPEPLRSAAFRTAWFYDSIGILVAFGFVDERLVVATINYRIRQVWRAVAPYARVERDLRGAPFLDFLEDLAARAFAKDPNRLHHSLGLHRVDPAMVGLARQGAARPIAT